MACTPGPLRGLTPPHLGIKTVRAQCGPGHPQRMGGLPGGGRAESSSLGLSQPQPGAGQPRLMGTAQANARTEHQSTDKISIKILCLPALNSMKFLLV